MTATRAVAVLLLASLTSTQLSAATATDSGGPPAGALSASASLDFTIDIGKFMFFRVGTGAYPTASSTVDTVTFDLAIPPLPTVPPGAGSNVAVPWSAALPAFQGTGNVLAAEVRSNAGQVTIQASVVSPLVSGPNTIPMSEITVSSSDANFPAPILPNTGTGAAVNVTGTAFSNLVTIRSANWTFSYSPTSLPLPGTYSGQVSFTAAAP